MEIVLQENLLISLATAYAIIVLLMSFFSGRKPAFKTDIDKKPVSVIVAFHNEANQLPDLVKSFGLQSYPDDLAEFIFVDDRSDDQSVKMLKLAIGKHMPKKVHKIIHIDQASAKSGKKAALQEGIAAASHNILLFTDADCYCDPNWIESTITHYRHEETAAVIGLAPLRSKKKTLSGFFSEAETFFNHIIAYISFKLKRPVMSFGRNFSYRKDVFKELGGFSGIEQSLSGDDDLFLEKLRQANYKVGFDLDSQVISSTKDSLAEFNRQKTRHISAARFFDWRYQLIAGVFHLLHLLFYVLLILQFSATSLFIKLAADAILFLSFNRQFKFISLWRVYILWELFYWLYIFLIGFKGYLVKIRLLKWT